MAYMNNTLSEPVEKHGVHEQYIWCELVSEHGVHQQYIDVNH